MVNETNGSSASNLVTILGLLVVVVGATAGVIFYFQSQIKNLEEKRLPVLVSEEFALVSEEAQKGLKEIVNNFRRELTAQKLPIGAVMASYLSPDTMREVYGESWQLADGRGMKSEWEIYKLEKDRYEADPSRAKLPDLRGRFLRGLVGAFDPATEPNVAKRDPDYKNRYPGHAQEDAFEKHTHGFYGLQQPSPIGHWAMSHVGSETAEPGILPAGSADETRPKNVAVYFYIKVN